MKFSKNIIAIDDNRVALMLSQKMIQQVAKDYTLTTYQSAQAVTEYLETLNELPSVIFSDLNMEGMNGIEFLAWCKRHPKFHRIPIVIVTAETTIAEDLISQGAVSICLKPLQQENMEQSFKQAITKISQLSEDDKSLELAFYDESTDLIERLNDVLSQPNLTEKEINETYRIFHTLKGVSASLEYNYLSYFIHKGENFLTLVKNKNRCSHPQVKVFLQEVFNYFSETFLKFKKSEQAPLLNANLQLLLKNSEQFLESAWLEKDKVDLSSSESQEKIISSANSVQTSSIKSETIRVKHKELDEIQAQLKKILQLKVQMNHFGRQLNEEFYDESFPKDLMQMITKLETSSLTALESLIMLRVQSLETLIPYAEKLVKELCQKLNKECDIVFSKNANVEVDTPIIELMKAAFTHILRNALDHGIETPDERRAKNKEGKGKIEVFYEKLENKTFRVGIKDNGRGIIKAKLKKALIDKKILTEQQVNDMNDHQLNQMIFVDGLSTKSEVSDISGRGVGISAVKDDIEKMNGTLKVESTEEVGTEFTITLPLYFVL